MRLSNPLLNIGIMQSEADLAYQENELRNTRISMEQERLSLKQDRIGMQKDFLIKKRRYGQYKRLMEEQLIARRIISRLRRSMKRQKNNCRYWMNGSVRIVCFV